MYFFDLLESEGENDENTPIDGPSPTKKMKYQEIKVIKKTNISFRKDIENTHQFQI